MTDGFLVVPTKNIKDTPSIPPPSLFMWWRYYQKIVCYNIVQNFSNIMKLNVFLFFFFSSAFVTGVTHTALQWTSPVKQRWKIHTKRMLQWLQNGPGTEQINLVKKTHEVVGMRGGVMNSKSLHLH